MEERKTEMRSCRAAGHSASRLVTRLHHPATFSLPFRQRPPSPGSEPEAIRIRPPSPSGHRGPAIQIQMRCYVPVSIFHVIPSPVSLFLLLVSRSAMIELDWSVPVPVRPSTPSTASTGHWGGEVSLVGFWSLFRPLGQVASCFRFEFPAVVGLKLFQVSVRPAMGSHHHLPTGAGRKSFSARLPCRQAGSWQVVTGRNAWQVSSWGSTTPVHPPSPSHPPGPGPNPTCPPKGEEVPHPVRSSPCRQGR